VTRSTGPDMAWANDPRRGCRGMDTDLFFGSYSLEKKRSSQTPRNPRPVVVPYTVVAACEGCPVRRQCLDHAIEYWEQGYWGGTTPAQRRDLRGRTAKRQRLEAHMSRFDWPGNESAERKARQRREDRK